jgi:RND family efflux transporter MFP subunit
MAADWKRNWKWTVLIMVMGLSLAYGLLVGKSGPEAQPVAMPEPPLVDVVSAEPMRRSLQVKTQGTVRPLREISLVSQVGGLVEAVSPQFAEGGFFSANTEIVRIEPIAYELAVARAKSDVAAARQRVAEEKGRSRQARREWRDLGSDEANALFLRKPQLASAEAALTAAEAHLKSARLDLERTGVVMPFNGRISEKYVGLGQYIVPGTAIAKVYDTDVAQVRLPLTDRQVALLDLPLNYDGGVDQPTPGAQVTLSARFGGRSWQWQGHIARTDANIDIDSRVVYAVAEVQQPFAREQSSGRPPLAPGLFVDALISGRTIAGVSLLPRSALSGDGSVMIVDKQQRAQPRNVQVLKSDVNQVWVQGLDAGERVIVNQTGISYAGMEVAVKTVAAFASGVQ